MKDIWNTCKFSSDVISADFSKARFAVEMHEFLDGTADRTYQDPQTFFDNTFLTDQMKLLVRDVLTRLDSGRGQPVTVIDTGFGGGKTHSLLLLHHILKNRGIGLDFVRKHGISSDMDADCIPPARIVEIDCREITKNTLWGEIAHRLGRYSEFEEMDTRQETPLDIASIKGLLDGPVLIMLDELPHYLFKADSIRMGNSTLGEQTILFVMELISAVASSPRACLILTLTENQSLYKSYSAKVRSNVNRSIVDLRVDDLVGSLNEAISRQAHTMTPVNPNQIYDVVKTRLVKHVDEAEKAATIREYAAYYEKHGLDVGDMLEKMGRSYPFHPNLIDILYKRVSTIDKFNQTRGMLRLLARIVRQVMEEKPPCKIIGTSEIRFDNTEIKDELTVRLGINMGVVIDVDCVGHAKDADSAKSVSVVGPISAAIMLFSLHGDTKKSGMKRGHIKATVGRPGLEPSLIDKALDEDMANNFWYIHDIGGQEYYFDEFPNINAIIHEHKRFVAPSEAKATILSTLDSLLPGPPKAILWDPNGIKDDDTLKLFVAQYDANLTGDAGDAYMADILARSGDGIRTNKNTIVVAYAAPDHVRFLKRTARTLVAIRKAKKDEKVKADKRFMREIASKETDAAAQLKSDCLMTYSNIIYPHGASIRHSEIRFGESKSTTITGAVSDLLVSRGKMVNAIGPDGLEVGDAPVKIRKIYGSFATDRSKPFVLDKGSIGEAVRNGLRTGKFGYCTEIHMAGGKYITEKEAHDFGWDGFLVSGKMVHKEEKDRDEVTADPPPAQKFRYTVHIGNFGVAHNFVRRIPTLNLDDDWKSSKKDLRANVRVGDMRITISGALSDYKPLKDVLNAMSSSNPDGDTTIYVTSDSDLASFFKENNLEGYVQ